MGLPRIAGVMKAGGSPIDSRAQANEAMLGDGERRGRRPSAGAGSSSAGAGAEKARRRSSAGSVGTVYSADGRVKLSVMEIVAITSFNFPFGALCGPMGTAILPLEAQRLAPESSSMTLGYMMGNVALSRGAWRPGGLGSIASATQGLEPSGASNSSKRDWDCVTHCDTGFPHESRQLLPVRADLGDRPRVRLRGHAASGVIGEGYVSSNSHEAAGLEGGASIALLTFVSRRCGWHNAADMSLGREAERCASEPAGQEETVSSGCL